MYKHVEIRLRPNACDGPYEMIKRQEKYFALWIKGKTVNVTLVRLKVAFKAANEFPSDKDKSNSTTLKPKEPSADNVPVTVTPNPKHIKLTRSGRKVIKPLRFAWNGFFSRANLWIVILSQFFFICIKNSILEENCQLSWGESYGALASNLNIIRHEHIYIRS